MSSDPRREPHWQPAVERGDAETARAAWAQLHAGAEKSLEALEALAEIEERLGDVHVLGDAMQAKAHYLRASAPSREAMDGVWRVHDANGEASRALGTRVVERCQEAYSRTFRKYQSISNQGRVDDVTRLVPHPRSGALKAHIERVREARQEAGRQRRRADAAVLADGGSDDASLLQAMARSEYARRWSADAQVQFGLGQDWSGVADDLVERHPASARLALAWSRRGYEGYHAQWTAHLPASRWDPDGKDGIFAADRRRAALAGSENESAAPAWADAFLRGSVEKAVRLLDGSPCPAAFMRLFDLLRRACENDEPLAHELRQHTPRAWT